MIFISEPQTNFSKDYKEEYQIFYPLSEAGYIYKFLYNLETDYLKTIEHIHFYYKEPIDEKLYIKTFNTYSANPTDYKFYEVVRQNIEIFPTFEQIENDDKRKVIETLINKTELYYYENSKNLNSLFEDNYKKSDDLLLFLPYSDSIIQHVLKHFNHQRITLVSDYRAMRVKYSSGIKVFDTTVYNKIRNTLQKIKESYERETIDVFTHRNFRPPTFLENFKDNYFENLISIIADGKKRVQMSGEDNFIIADSIKQLIRNEFPEEHDLLNGVPLLENTDSSLVIRNFDKIDTPSNYRKLATRLDKIKEMFYVILQAARYIKIDHFVEFENINLPDRQTIINSITSLFISLLIERRKYNKDFYKLLPLLQNNAFENLLNDFNDIEDIYETIEQIEQITIEDLISNSNLWYFIVTEIKNISNKRNNVPKLTKKEKIEFCHAGAKWEIVVSGKTQFYNYSTIGIQTIVCIIRYWQKTNEKIDVTKLRDLVVKYSNNTFEQKKIQNIKSSKDFNLYNFQDSCRKTVQAGISNKTFENSLREFIKKHIKYEKNQYWLDDKNSIDVFINDRELDKILP